MHGPALQLGGSVGGDCWIDVHAPEVDPTCKTPHIIKARLTKQFRRLQAAHAMMTMHHNAVAVMLA